jgi:hypothetical protein
MLTPSFKELQMSTHTHPRRLVSGSAPLASAGAAVTATLVTLHLEALKAAGLNVAKPVGGTVLATLINTLQANWNWLLITGVGLIIAVIAGLVMFGSQRAPEHVFRIAGGLALLIVVGPAVLH